MLHVRAFDLWPKNPEQMSESNTPNASELARLRALVADYEAKMTYLVMRIKEIVGELRDIQHTATAVNDTEE